MSKNSCLHIKISNKAHAPIKWNLFIDTIQHSLIARQKFYMFKVKFFSFLFLHQNGTLFIYSRNLFNEFFSGLNKNHFLNDIRQDLKPHNTKCSKVTSSPTKKKENHICLIFKSSQKRTRNEYTKKKKEFQLIIIWMKSLFIVGTLGYNGQLENLMN